MLYPFDEFGRRIAPSALPARLDDLRYDPYRDLAWSVREAGGYEKSQRPFAEFQWAGHFRTRISRALMRDNYKAAVKAGLKQARSGEAAGLPGWIG